MDAKVRELFQTVFEEKIPFNKFLGLKLDDADDGKATVSFDFKPELIGNFESGILHGGVISAVLDVVGAVAVLSQHAKEGKILLGFGTVDLRVDFLTPASGKHFTARGEVMRLGRILSSTRMEFYNEEGTLNATGAAIYRLSRRDNTRETNI